MLFVKIFVNKSLTFPFLQLTILYCWLQQEGNVVFFSDMILLIASALVFFPLGKLFVFVLAVH